MMRVIAGEYGGRRLKAPDTRETRPVTDRVKESLFSSLGALVEGARVADLYAGAGSFGIEAISRGAKSVIFVESANRALATLRGNLTGLGIDAHVVAGKVESFVEQPESEFDIVFCDPPWDLTSGDLSLILETLRVHLAEDAMVVVTRRSIDPVPEPIGYRIDDERRHGDTRILRYMKESE